jgi:glycerol-3-phosphate cytidylyltransferase
MKKTIITYGTFDTFHFGHLELLKRAKEMGDYLIVGLSTDDFNELKGKITKFSYWKRKEWLESIKYVDLIIPEEKWEQKITDIENYNVDIFVIGNDWKGKFDYLPCKVIYLDRTKGISTTQIKQLK